MKVIAVQLVLLIGCEVALAAYIPRALAWFQKRNLEGLQKLKRDWIKDSCNRECASSEDCCADYKCSFSGSLLEDFKKGICELDCDNVEPAAEGESCEKCFTCQSGLMCMYTLGSEEKGHFGSEEKRHFGTEEKRHFGSEEKRHFGSEDEWQLGSGNKWQCAQLPTLR